MKDPQPCGGWPSPIGSADLVRGALRLSAPRIQRGVLYWLEGRPNEGGRQVVMAGDLREPGALTRLREITPPEANVRTRVHEYGGGEFALGPDWLFYVDDRDRGIHASARTAHAIGTRVRIFASDSSFADLSCSPDGRWLIAVEERPRSGQESENRLVAFALDGLGRSGDAALAAPRVIAAGHDFYASPSFSPSGRQVAFLAWDHPAMPWTGTLLETLEWGPDGPSGRPFRRAGGRTESIFQPRYASDGTLFAVTDRSGWWNLARITEQGVEPVHRIRAELGRPQWVFGMSTWTFLSNRSVLASATFDGSDEWIGIDVESGAETRWPARFCTIGGVTSGDGWVACVAGSPTEASGVQVARIEDRAFRCVRESSDLRLSSDWISRGEPRAFELTDGRSTHAFFYAPTSARACPRPGERPPLLVKSHGGPTSSTSTALDPRIQFWTSRGFAVADVNYGGSSGYGRAYRDRLAGAWGIVDVEDCVAVAEALAAEAAVDGRRRAISGGSAGGYTTLCALTFHSVFAAGASHYGIGDLEALVRDTHKFESRYTDWLVGEWPRERARYVARSPIHHPERLSCPVIFFQGLEDRVVPPNQAEAMVAVLARRGIAHAYVPFEGEQHGFRRAENIRTALDGELYFYSQIFGFEAPRPEAVQVVGRGFG